MGKHPITVGPVEASLLGWVLVGLTNAVLIASSLPSEGTHAVQRAWHHLYDLGHFGALAAVSAAAVWAWERAGVSTPLRDLGARFGVALVVAAATLGEDAQPMSERLADSVPPSVLLAGVVLVGAAGVSVVPALAHRLARPRVRWIGVAGALSLQAINPFVLVNDYPGAHLFIAWAAALASASCLRGSALPEAVARPLRAQALPPPARIAIGVAVAGLLAAACFTWPSATVTVRLFRHSGSVLPTYLAALRSPMGGSSDVEPGYWLRDRTGVPPVPPTSPPAIDGAPVVLLLGIDAVRWDVLATKEHDRQLPTLAKLREESVRFELARAPGSQTVYTYASMFAGTYFSQQVWTEKKIRKATQLWPHEDDTPRFPGLLQEAGVRTVNVASADWMQGPWGVVRGFGEDVLVPKGSDWATAEALTDVILNWLGTVDERPLFVFSHFLDPHAPYSRATRKGTPFERHLAEVALVDKQLARIVDFIDKAPWKERAVIVLCSDHGEGFGDHGTPKHAITLYEELLRVPLLVRSASLAPATVNEPVGLIDLGPTLLDLFGVDTPSFLMGQSLVPFLIGERPKLTRPILAEGRLMRSLVTREGMKVIVDLRKHTVELYDLNQDAKELVNLADDEEKLAQPKAVLDRFFKVHTVKKRGYKLPYRR